jgi:hypothetical protein
LKIIAIDPGPRESAFVWFDGEIHRHGKHPNVEILDLLKYHSRNLLEDYCVIEMIASYGMPVGAEVFETCVWIGRFMQAYDVACTRRITRGEVKMREYPPSLDRSLRPPRHQEEPRKDLRDQRGRVGSLGCGRNFLR